MGLDTTHDCWHGPYSAFSRWRNGVARAAGIQLRDDGGFTVPDIPWDKITEANVFGEWEEPPNDPLWYLLAHSDCEGVIKAAHCGPLADRLQGIVDNLSARALYDDIRLATERFIAGLRKPPQMAMTWSSTDDRSPRVRASPGGRAGRGAAGAGMWVGGD